MRLDPRYFIAEAVVSFRRNLMMGLAAVSTAAITFFIVGIFVFLVYDANSIVKAIERQVEISVYLKDSVSSELRDTMENEIRSWPEVKSVKYISKEEALQKFISTVGENSDIAKEIQGNPFPASFEISLKNPREVEKVAGRFINDDGSYKEGIDEVVYGKQYVGKLFSITATIGLIIALIIALLLLSAIILIYNTIRLAIYARRKEVEVMKLVGASNWFVMWPFVLEGVIEGFLGGAVAVFLLWLTSHLVLVKAERAIAASLHIWKLSIVGDSPIQAAVFLGILCAGVVLGAAGSAIALKRFLRV